MIDMTERKKMIEGKKVTDSYARLHNLTEGKKGKESDFGMIFKRLVSLLENSGESGRIQFEIGSGEERQYWSLELKEKACKISEGKIEKPNFEVLGRAKTLLQVAEGNISPIIAIGRGKMRVRGDIEFGRRLYKLLAADEGRTGPCP